MAAHGDASTFLPHLEGLGVPSATVCRLRRAHILLAVRYISACADDVCLGSAGANESGPRAHVHEYAARLHPK